MSGSKDVKSELEQCMVKKRLYKDLYHGEKDNKEELQQHYLEEMKVKECWLVLVTISFYGADERASQ